jgi:hypothetical protein
MADVLLFVSGVAAVAIGTLAGLYFLVRSANPETTHEPAKGQMLSHWH